MDELLTEEEVTAKLEYLFPAGKIRTEKEAADDLTMMIWVIAKAQIAKLQSRGYVKMVEQKLPEIKNETGINDFLNGKYSGAINYREDMLSVDSEGCAYRRVKVK